MAYDMRLNDSYPVTCAAWTLLPADEDEAERLRGHVCKDGIEICRRCGGTGEAEEDADGGPTDMDLDKDFGYGD